MAAPWVLPLPTTLPALLVREVHGGCSVTEAAFHTSAVLGSFSENRLYAQATFIPVKRKAID